MLIVRARTVQQSLLLAAFLSCTSAVTAQTSSPTSSVLELKKFSLEELMNIEVTSVSRTEERLSNAPAALAVVTGEDIRRSGATTVQDALRGVPGLHVGRERSTAWALSARGFSSVN